MNPASYLDRLTESGTFRFDRLQMDGFDNEPVLKINVPEVVEQETCLFHRDVYSGNQYLDILHATVQRALAEKAAMPIVRFADGEYAFYRLSLHCNGLYQQAENVEAIRAAIPSHIDAFKAVARMGKLAPLVFPGNTRKKERGFFSFLRKSKSDDSAIGFLDFLAANGIELTGNKYVPFYAVYAYLVTGRFARLLDGKTVCVVNPEYNEETFQRWFEAFSSRPRLFHTPIPEAYVATRWDSMRKGVLSNIPRDVDFCLVGAGIGALQVCVDIAERFSIPAVDAGHVMNMMNGRVDKSNGPRLYTLWKEGGA